MLNPKKLKLLFDIAKLDTEDYKAVSEVIDECVKSQELKNLANKKAEELKQKKGA